MPEYEDSVFVGDCNTGNLYRFKLDSVRMGFVFESPELSDKVHNIDESMDEIVFGTGFGCITDIEVGPDGLIYIVSLSEERIYRIIPKAMAQEIVVDGTTSVESKGGCLIATAAYGTEMAQSVQMLREIRDDVYGTRSGAVFMSSFNSVYYLFSPTIADLERESPAFREAVKAAVTPLLSTLLILSHVDIDSEYQLLGYGAGIILLNVGIYFVIPAVLVKKTKDLLGRKIPLKNS
jgi:hypothetical protein